MTEHLDPPREEPSDYVTSPEETAEIAELREAISPSQTLAALDTFGKWMFGASAAIGSLGGAFSASGHGPEHGVGRWVFAGAVVCAAVSLALSVVALIPYRVTATRWSLDSLTEAYGRIVLFRRRLLAWSGGFLAVGLILAGVSPLWGGS
jgi:hypothetical protein